MRTFFIFFVLLALSTTATRAADTSPLSSWEISVRVETETTIKIYDDSGAVIYPLHVIHPSSALDDWTADLFSAASGGPDCIPCDWSGDWDLLATLFIVIELVADGPGAAPGETRTYAYAPGGTISGNSGNFYTPSPVAGGSPDIVFTVFDDDGNTEIHAADDPSVTYEEVLGSSYVVPYNNETYCLVAGCNSDHNVFFLSPVPSVAQATARRFRFSAAGHAIVQPGWTTNWDVPGLTLEFPNRTLLIAEGSLAMDGVTLTEAVAGEGWYGVLYQPDGGGVLRGVTIEKFGYQLPPGARAYPICGLTVNDRWLAVYRSTIQDGINGANGVCSIGDNAQISLRGEIDPVSQQFVRTKVRRNDGDGLLAFSQGRIFVRNSLVELNIGNGGVALGTRSIIYANEFSSISGNGGVGLVARSNGNIYLYNPNTPSATTETTIDGNIGGGLLAQSQGSYINAGTFNYVGGAQGTCLAACENFITGHPDVGAPFDAKASGGSFISAERDHWGPDRDENDLILDEYATSTIEVLPIWDGVSSLRGGPPATRMAAEPSGFRDGMRGQIVEAMENAAQGRWIPAFAQMQSAVAGAATGDDRQLVLGAATALLGLPDGPEVPSGLIQAIEAHMGQGQQGRPYALRTLLTAHRVRGHDGDARTMAQALIADFPLTEHALTGLAQEVELALEADDLIAAQVALATMEADFPDDLLTAATRAYFVLVAGADALPERVAATPAVASSGVSNSAISAGVDGFALHAAYPNPFNPQTVVPFSVAATSRVRIVVFDMLGREVAVLVDGRVDTGLHTVSFDGSQLASGIYLLKATVRPETGSGMQTYTQRPTLLK